MNPTHPQKAVLIMRYLHITVALMLMPTALLAADFNAGMAAYERQDYTTAAREFNELAESGDLYAQYMLGRLYENGNGVAQDYVLAHKWYNLAGSRGSHHAAQARDALAKQMPSAQTSKAQSLASAWKPRAAATAATTAPAARPATPKDMRATIQKRLNDLGYDAGTADGTMGGKTRAAIRDYQTDSGIPVDGQPTQALLDRLTAASPGVDTKGPAPTSANAPWQRLLLHDAFQDGDYTKNPIWSVSAGTFLVETGIGLRTAHEPRKPLSETRREDLPKALLSAILAQATRPSGSVATTEAPDYAEIHVDGGITNAFAIQLKLTLRQAATGPLAFGPYQAGDRLSGYRLVYTPNVARGFHLVRQTASGSSVIESVEAKFSLNQEYAIQWTRDQRGEMTVSLDGKEVIRISDRSLADPFTGFTLVNRGGDYAVREISVYGID